MGEKKTRKYTRRNYEKIPVEKAFLTFYDSKSERIQEV